VRLSFNFSPPKKRFMSYLLPKEKKYLYDEIDEYVYPGLPHKTLCKKHVSGIPTHIWQLLHNAGIKNLNYTIKRSRGNVETYSRESRRYFVPRRMRHVSYREGRVKHVYTHKREQEKDTFKIPRKIFIY
jgi:hypothetical protein